MVVYQGSERQWVNRSRHQVVLSLVPSPLTSSDFCLNHGHLNRILVLMWFILILGFSKNYLEEEGAHILSRSVRKKPTLTLLSNSVCVLQPLLPYVCGCLNFAGVIFII